MQCEEGTEWLLELLTEVQLQQYFKRIRDDLNVTRLSHFDYVKNEDLEKIGLGRPGEAEDLCVRHQKAELCSLRMFAFLLYCAKLHCWSYLLTYSGKEA